MAVVFHIREQKRRMAGQDVIKRFAALRYAIHLNQLISDQVNDGVRSARRVMNLFSHDSSDEEATRVC